MSNQFLGEIFLFAGNFPPRGSALCNGQIMQISQNPALYSLLGINFGGDGQTTFGLPNFQAKVPVSQGQGNGLSNYSVGQQVGASNVALVASQMPQHNHSLTANTTVPALKGTGSPAGAVLAETNRYAAPGSGVSTTLAASALTPAGGSLPHDNVQPVLALNFCIATTGIYPPRP